MLYLSPADLGALDIHKTEVLEAVRAGVTACAEGVGTAEPTVGYSSGQIPNGAIYTVRGAHAGLGLTSVKVVGAFPGNRDNDMPPDTGLMGLYSWETGAPVALLDSSFVTLWRTAALVAMAGETFARRESRILACVGARGIAPLVCEFLCDAFKLDEVRVHASTEGSRKTGVDRLSPLAPVVRSAASWHECIEGADIVIDGAGLSSHAAHFPNDVVSQGQTILSYGAYSSLTADIFDKLDNVFMDRWVDGDTGASGGVGPLIAEGRLTKDTVSGFLGDVVTGRSKGRTDDRQALLVCIRGLAPCDITLGDLLIRKAQAQGMGTRLSYHN